MYDLNSFPHRKSLLIFLIASSVKIYSIYLWRQENSLCWFPLQHIEWKGNTKCTTNCEEVGVLNTFHRKSYKFSQPTGVAHCHCKRTSAYHLMHSQSVQVLSLSPSAQQLLGSSPRRTQPNSCCLTPTALQENSHFTSGFIHCTKTQLSCSK